jgi:Co/Zn/Cd efflux system component
MSGCECDEAAATLERRTLVTLLVVNAAMFVAEVVAGWLGGSAGLMADSLDMFADASVYAIALAAVGRAHASQARAAFVSGMLQGVLGLGMLAEVARRVVVGSEPVSTVMMGVGAAALVANVACLVLIARHRDGGVHMRASWIFSTNDVIANLGVIVSGALVALLHSRLPDLVIGAVVSLLVLRGAVRILREARAA